MMIDDTVIGVLPIEKELQIRLMSVLNEFNSHRIGEVYKKEVKEAPPKKEKLSFLQRLFLTEYD